MPTEKRIAQTVINRPADEVWARVRDFGDITWIPNHGACVVEGDVRKISKDAWGFVLEQRLVDHDDENRTYSYALPHEVNFESLLGPGRIVRVIDGKLQITARGDSESLVTFEVETEDFLIEGTHAEYQGALDSLKAELEG
jgi:hypothetical protein